jgi:O-antigen biosynthesis protein
MPGKSPFLKRFASRPIAAMTSRYPRLNVIKYAVKELVEGRPLPSIDWITLPVSLRRSPSEAVRLNGFATSINPAKGWAGNMMVIELLESLAPLFGATRILVSDKVTPAEVSRFPGFRLVRAGEESDEPRQVVSIKDAEGRPLPIGAHDICLTSHWSHAYMAINQIIPWQSREYGQAPNPLVYLVQDYEPGFSPWSSEYLLARSTYYAPNPVAAVFSSSLLRDYFRDQGHVFSREFSFEPKLNSVLRQNHYKDGPPPAKKRQILVYGRPWEARNAFGLLEAGLRAWRGRFPDAHRWQVISRGEAHRDIDLGGGVVMKSVGRTSLEQYARILLESAIGVSLMVSPHPSFPPIEMAHFGLWTITNRFANKDLSLLHDNFVSLEDARPDSIADHLIMLCRRFEADPASGYRGASRMPHYLDDTPTFPFVGDLVKDLDSLRP